MATIVGTSGPDQLIGTSADDAIIGGGGDDFINGMEGADEMWGGDGADEYVVDNVGDNVVEFDVPGVDWVRTTLAAYTLGAWVENLTRIGNSAFTGTGNGLDNYISGGGGNDTLDGKGGADILAGYGGNDTYYVDHLGDIVDEALGAGTDRIFTTLASYTLPANVENLFYNGPAGQGFAATGNGLNNYIEGGSGNDGLNGGAGADTLVGLGGNDSYLVDNVGDVVTEGLGGGTDLVYTTLSTYTLPVNVENLTYVGVFGSAFTGTGNGLNNTLTGWGGNDILNGGAGADTMIGRTGNDTYWVDDAGDVVTEAAGEGTDEVRTTRSSYTLSANVERLRYFGPASDDFTGRGNELDNYIEGWNGNDLLDGKGGADHMVGLLGDDDYRVDHVGDLVVEAAGGGTDTVQTTLSAYTLPNHVERLVYAGSIIGSFSGQGNNLDNYIEGWNGNDILNGFTGADTLVGLGGDDTYHVDNAADVVVETANNGIDTVMATSASYTLPAHVENLTHWSIFLVNFNAVGNGLANVIKTAGGNDTLNGMGGADILEGGAGDDLYYVDQTDDVVIEAANGGTDTVRSTATVYTLAAEIENLVFTGVGNLAFTGTGNALANSITGLDGNDVLDGKGGADIMTGLWGDDTYYVDDAGDQVVEALNNGTDTVRTTLAVYALGAHVERLIYDGPSGTGFTGTGNALANLIEGWNGDDKLDGGLGADTMVGKNGNDQYWVNDVNDVVVELVGFGTDTVWTTLSSYTLGANVENLIYVGAASTDFTGTGNALNNGIEGWNGDDILDGMGGDDTMAGLNGDDLYFVDSVGDTVIEESNAGNDTINTTLTVYVLGANVEGLRYFGDPFAAFTGTGNALDNYLEGWAGNDTLDGAGGADVMKGLAGNDVYFVDSLADQVIEEIGHGIDEVRTGVGSAVDFAQMYVLPANVEKLVGTSAAGQGVFGNALDNIIGMSTGNDLVAVHQGGNDFVATGAGDDFIYFGATFTNGDTVIGGAGYDTVGLLGDYVLTFEADDLQLVEKLALYSSGAPGSNDYNITMNDGNVAAGKQLMVVAQSLLATETLIFNGSAELDGSFNVRGGRGADTVTGGAKADQIWGGLGADTLMGGGGNDMFEYYDVAESTAGAQDNILDFSSGDKINLKAIDADGNAANGNSKFAFIGSAAFSGVAGQLRATFANGQWLVEADANGDGVADLSILVTTLNGHMLGAADFYL